MLADVRGLGGRIGKRHRLVEGLAGLGAAVELLQQGALDAMEVEVAREPGRERLTLIRDPFGVRWSIGTTIKKG